MATNNNSLDFVQNMTITRFTMADMLVCPDLNLVKQGQVQIRLTPQEMAVLLILAKAAPLSVSKQALVSQVWNDRIGAEQLVPRIIADLRKKLKDNARKPLYIYTVIKKGYQLLPQVQFIENLTQSTQQTSQFPSVEQCAFFSRSSGIVVCALLSVLIAVTIVNGLLDQPVVALSAQAKPLSTDEMARSMSIRRTDSITGGMKESLIDPFPRFF